MNIKEESIIRPLPTLELVTEKEKKWRINLPEEYKEFILQYSGAIPCYKSFSCSEGNYKVERFLCILKDLNENEFGWYDISVVESQIGERLTSNEELIGIELLPIAKLLKNDYLCLDFGKSELNPSVCVWSNEESGEFEPVTYWVANNFEDFCNLLKE